MPRRPRLRKVNVRLYEQDVAAVQDLAAMDCRSWHALLRDLVREALKARGASRVTE